MTKVFSTSWVREAASCKAARMHVSEMVEFFQIYWPKPKTLKMAELSVLKGNNISNATTDLKK